MSEQPTLDRFEEVRPDLTDPGYTEWAPGGAAEIDRPIVEAEPCQDCGGPVKFRPFTKITGQQPTTYSYRPFGVCVNCGGCFEF